jgi:hypothetical protein
MSGLVLVACGIEGGILTIIGIRYFLVPESAAYTFGVADRPTGYEMHYIIALRVLPRRPDELVRGQQRALCARSCRQWAAGRQDRA